MWCVLRQSFLKAVLLFVAFLPVVASSQEFTLESFSAESAEACDVWGYQFNETSLDVMRVCLRCSDGYTKTGDAICEKTTFTLPAPPANPPLQTSAAPAECGPGWFLSNGVCGECSPSCATCAGSAQQCTSCRTGALILGKCVEVCPPGSSYDRELGDCRADAALSQNPKTAEARHGFPNLFCPHDCEKCSFGDGGSAACVSCFSGFYFEAVSNECLPSSATRKPR